MYSIIGGDGKTYGPVPASEIQRWIAEHRADGRSRVRKEGEENWQSLGSLEEFFPRAITKPAALPGSGGMEIRPGLQVNACLQSAWSAFSFDAWRIMGVSALTVLALGVVNFIPFVGSILGFLLNGPVWGGLYFFARQSLHREARGVEDVSGTAQQRFLPCFLSITVSQILAACPFFLGLIPTLAMGIVLGGSDWSDLFDRPFLALLVFAPALIGFLGTLYLSLLWAMALPLAACSSLDFWEAMKTSWQAMRMNLLPYLALVLVLAGLNFLGALFCFIGLFVTIPLTFLATMAAYEQIFHPTTTGPR